MDIRKFLKRPKLDNTQSSVLSISSVTSGSPKASRAAAQASSSIAAPETEAFSGSVEQESPVAPEAKACSNSVASESSRTALNIVKANNLDSGVARTREYDIGRYVGYISDSNMNLFSEAKCEAFINTWVPEKDYNFEKVGKRSFRYEWLQTCSLVGIF